MTGRQAMSETDSAGCFLGVERSLGGRRWQARLADDRQALALAQRLDVPEVVGRVMAGRGIGLDEAGDYLNPTLRALLPDPSHLKDMDAAAQRLARAVTDGEAIAVFGVGGVGVNVLQGASLVNAYPIVAIDLHDHKLEQALAFGATHTVNSSKEDPEAFLRELVGPQGFDVTVDLTGIGSVREVAYNSTSNTGKTVLAGVPHHQERITIDSFPLHFGRRIFGSHGGETRPDVDIPRYLNLYKLGKLKLKEQITHRYPLAEINQAVNVVQTGQAGRCVVSLW